MTTKHNPDECARLIAEARGARLEFDAGAPPNEETSSSRYVEGWNDAIERFAQPMADQLEAQQAEIARLGHAFVCEERLAAEGAATITKLTAERDKLRADLADMIRNFEAAESEAEQLRTLVQALRFDTDQRDKLQAELEAARREVERLAAYEREYGDAALLLNSLRVPLSVDGKHLTMVERIDAYRAARDKAATRAAYIPPTPSDYVCTVCGETMRAWHDFEEYQHSECGGLVERAARDKVSAPMSEADASAHGGRYVEPFDRGKP